MADITLIRGDSDELTISVTDADSEVVNLTGATARFTVKRRMSDPDDRALIAKALNDGITIADPLTGVLAVAIDPADTADLSPGTYLYDVQIRDGAGRVSTVAEGRAVVRADVTRAAE